MSEPTAIPARLFTAPDPLPTLAVPAEVPITLFPLRIETRFVRVVKDPEINTLEGVLSDIDKGFLTLASPDLVIRVSGHIRELGTLAIGHQAQVVEAEATRKRELEKIREELGRAAPTDKKLKSSVTQAQRAADLGAYLKKNEAALRPLLSEGYTRYREVDLALIQDAARTIQKRALAVKYSAALRKLAKAATPKGMQTARLQAVQTALGELTEAVQRLGSERRLRDRHAALDPKQLAIDVAAVDAEAMALSPAAGISSVQRGVDGLIERLGRLESYLARAAVGPDPIRIALRGSKGLSRLRDSAWSRELDKGLKAAAKIADTESSKEAVSRLGEAAAWLTATARVGTTTPSVPDWPPPTKEPAEPTPGPGTAPLTTLSDWELWIRVYPDDIAMTRLEPRLTADEVAAGRAYWTHRWYTPADQERALGAWRSLVARHGTPRASWIARCTRPLETDEKVDTDTLLAAPVFPEPAQRLPDEHQPPSVSTLPERLLFKLTHRDSGGHAPVHFLGEPIPATLAMGINPAEAVLNDQGAFAGNQAMSWMVDFEQAVRVGMALRVALPAEIANPTDPRCGFQRIEVLGVQQGAAPAQQDATAKLSALFEQHQLTGLGMSILPQGTATNTTSDKGSGVDLGEPDPRRSFALQQDQFVPTTDLLAERDGQHLARALGLNPTVFRHLDGAAGADVGTALAMNTALWHGTFGQHLEDLFYVEGPGNRARLTPELLDQTRSFFCRYVLGRGRVPVIRVGRQPYGILPMTNLIQNDRVPAPEVWQAGAGLSADATYRNGLYSLLQRLRKGHTHEYSTSHALHTLVGANEKLDRRATVDSPLQPGESANDRFMHLLGLQATGAELLHRYGVIVPFDATYSQFAEFVSGLAPPPASWAEVLKAYKDLFTGPTFVVGDALAALLGDNAVTAFTALHLSPLRSHALLTGWVDSAGNSAHLAYLQSTSPELIIDAARTGGEPSTSVLYLLARKATLQAYWDACARVWEAQPLIDATWSAMAVPAYLRSPSALTVQAVLATNDGAYIDSAAVTRDGADPAVALAFRYVHGLFRRDHYKEFIGGPATKRGFMELSTSHLAARPWAVGPLHKHLHGALGSATPGPLETHLSGLRQTRRALGILQEKTAAELDLALREHLDICSFRLDAWFSGLCFQRLEEQRAHTAKNLVGAYGWVEDLRPAGAAVNHGHIHGPSLQHALTGAVLRAAQVGGNGDIAAVNLSSYRVRQAQSLLDGIRSGQGLPELLGYQLERRLHELDPALNRFVTTLRAQFPLVARASATPPVVAGGAPIESLAASNVVDGLALVRARRLDPTMSLHCSPPGLPPSPSEAPKIQEALDDLDGALDAVGDLLLAEATFQTTRGNFDRAAAALQVLSDGRPPPEPEVIKTPTSTVALEHRVGLCLHPSTAAATATGRALAEPTLDAWLGRILGDLGKIHFRYTVLATDGTSAPGDSDVASLGLDPFDLVALLGKGELGPDSELAAWATVHVWSILPGRRRCAGITLDFTSRHPHWGPDVHTLRDTIPLARSLYRLVSGSRPLRGGDLASSIDVDGLGTDGIARVRLPELVQRVDRLHARYTALRDQLATFPWGNPLLPSIAHPGGPDTSALVALLRQIARHALPEALPADLALGSVDPISYLGRVRGLTLGIMAQRLAAFDQARAQLVSGLPIARQVEIHTQALRELLGKDFQICPWFDAHSSAQLRTAAQLPPRLPAVLARERWLHGVALVRRNVMPLEQSLMFGALWRDGAEQHLEPRVMQLPYTANEPWLGLEYDPALIPLDRERLSLVMLLPTSFKPDVEPCCGLLFDAWLEQLPLSDEQRTGLAFHYDQPNAEAPQIVLLACNSRPSPTAPWTHGELFDILGSTRQMMRLRSFEPDMLQPASTASSWPTPYEAQFIGLMGIGDIVTADFDELSVNFGVNNGTGGGLNVPTGGSTGHTGNSGHTFPTATPATPKVDADLPAEPAAPTPADAMSTNQIKRGP
jgi:hypothetical protein